MNILPLALVALIAAFVGLLELDWARFFADPAREVFRELVDELRGRRDLEAVVEVVGLGSVPVTLQLQALLQEGVVRVELLAPQELADHIFTYRQGILVHYRPFDGGVRFVRVFPGEERLPRLELDLGAMDLSLEEEFLGAGWDRFPRPPLALVGFAGSSPPPEGLARSLAPPPPLPGPLRLTISGLPEPVREVIVWLDRGTHAVKRITVALRTGRVNVRIEGLRFDTGISLHDILEIPSVRETIWYREAQSM